MKNGREQQKQTEMTTDEQHEIDHQNEEEKLKEQNSQVSTSTPTGETSIEENLKQPQNDDKNTEEHDKNMEEHEKNMEEHEKNVDLQVGSDYDQTPTG